MAPRLIDRVTSSLFGLVFFVSRYTMIFIRQRNQRKFAILSRQAQNHVTVFG